jgi:hypothetical protein
VPPQAAGDVGEDRLAVLEFDGKRRTREDLLDRPKELEWSFFRRFFRRSSRGARKGTAAGYDRTVSKNIIRGSVYRIAVPAR